MPAQDPRRSRLALLGAVAVVMVTASQAAAAPGDLDSTFDGDGKVTTQFTFDEEAHGVAIQADGKIVAAGYGASTARDFFLARYKVCRVTSRRTSIPCT